MENSEKIRRIKIYQVSTMFHQLTCGKDSSTLIPVELDSRVVLKCGVCGRIQKRFDFFDLVQNFSNLEEGNPCKDELERCISLVDHSESIDFRNALNAARNSSLDSNS